MLDRLHDPSPQPQYCGPYPSLDRYVGPQPNGAGGRIAILTQDIFGPVRNAGIGTAYMHAATFLAEQKFDVTILFTQGRTSQTRPIEYWIDFYRERGVAFVCADHDPGWVGFSPALRWSYAGFAQLSRLPPFAIVHSSECGASPYYALMAKRNRGLFPETLFCIKTSSPHLWSREGNEASIGVENGAVLALAERYCVEQADLVIAPSCHMLDWMKEHSYALPDSICVHPNIMPLSAAAAMPAEAGPAQPIEEIVFFGRLEPRKGISLFAEAIELALPRFGRACRVTFLGKTRGDDLDFNFESFLSDLNTRLGIDAAAITDKDAAQAIAYLREPGRLAVIPSLLDNSPFTVYEALVNRFAFLASAVGGIPELIHPDDRAGVLFQPRPAPFADMLVEAVAKGVPIARLSFRPVDSLDVWRRFHLAPCRPRGAAGPEAGEAPPMVAIPLPAEAPMNIPLEAMRRQIRQLPRDSIVFWHETPFTLAEADRLLIARTMRRSSCDIAIPAYAVTEGPNRGTAINFQPTMWTKLDFSRIATPALAMRAAAAEDALAVLSGYSAFTATNLDEIVAVAARREAVIHVYPDIIGRYEGEMRRRTNRAQRLRQVRLLAARLPADVANIFRIYASLQDDRARIVAAQPIFNNLRRLLRILRRTKTTAGDP